MTKNLLSQIETALHHLEKLIELDEHYKIDNLERSTRYQMQQFLKKIKNEKEITELDIEKLSEFIKKCRMAHRRGSHHLEEIGPYIRDKYCEEGGLPLVIPFSLMTLFIATSEYANRGELSSLSGLLLGLLVISSLGSAGIIYEIQKKNRIYERRNELEEIAKLCDCLISLIKGNSLTSQLSEYALVFAQAKLSTSQCPMSILVDDVLLLIAQEAVKENTPSAKDLKFFRKRYNAHYDNLSKRQSTSSQILMEVLSNTF
jgi:hypothetical protein